MNTREKVDRVFLDVIGIDPETEREKLVYNEIPDWDSVAHMTLVAGLEDAFDCMLEMEDILDMSSYEKTVDIMTKYE